MSKKRADLTLDKLDLDRGGKPPIEEQEWATLAERARREQPQKLFYQLLDDYLHALMDPARYTETLTGGSQRESVQARQTRVDKARLAIISEYELFAGKGAATDGEIRHKVASAIDNMRRKLSELTCPKHANAAGGDPVHAHTDGSFWFWDKTWADELGPFKDRPEAQKECDAYANQLLGPQWSDPPNKRGPE